MISAEDFETFLPILLDWFCTALLLRLSQGEILEAYVNELGISPAFCVRSCLSVCINIHFKL